MSIKLFSGTTGWNNIVDPIRLKLDFETGVVELAEALDVDIDDSGRIDRRLGYTSVAVGEYHSLFCDGGDCFVILETVGDAAIYKVGTNNVLVGVRSGLTKNLRMGWCQTSLGTYYSNGVQSGRITAGVSYPWIAQTYVGPPTTRTFGTPPLGTHLALFSSSMCVVNGKIVSYSEPLGYGLFDNARSRLRFASDVKLFKPVDGGVWASDSKRTYFLEGTNLRELIRHPRLECPAHEHSEAIGHINGADFGLDDAGECAVWSCDQGLCVGTAQGQLLVITKDKLNYPTGTRGASIISGSTVINSIDDSQCVRTNLRGSASSKYRNYGFNSMVNFNGGLYGARSDGLFQLASGSTDNTALLPATFTLPTTDFGSPNNKHLRFWYMGLETDGKIQIDLSAEGYHQTMSEVYRISPPKTGHQRIRTPIGRAIYGRYWVPKVSNVLGSDFSIDEIEVLPIVKSGGIS